MTDKPMSAEWHDVDMLAAKVTEVVMSQDFPVGPEFERLQDELTDMMNNAAHEYLREIILKERQAAAKEVRRQMFERLKFEYLVKYDPRDLPHKRSWALICGVFGMPVEVSESPKEAPND